MFKITLLDFNCSPISDGTVSFFVEKLENFEEKWLVQEEIEEDEERVERYFRSKAGEMVTDYYSNNPELNIVQEDAQAQVLWEKEYLLEDRTYAVVNAYWCESKIYAKEAHIILRKLFFKGKEYLIGKYRLVGVCSACGAKEEGAVWERCRAYGNPILLKKYVVQDRYVTKDREVHYWNKEHFAEDELETYVWIALEGASLEELDIENAEGLTDKILEVLLADIPGEAG